MTTETKFIKGSINKSIKRSISISSFENIQNYDANVQSVTKGFSFMKNLKLLPNENNFQKSKFQPEQPKISLLIKGCDIFFKYLKHLDILGKNFQRKFSNVLDIVIRFTLLYVFCKMEVTPAFRRIIHLEEMWLYKNPRTEDYVSGSTLLISVTFGPFIITLFYLLITKDKHDFFAATWTWTLCLVLNGLITSLLKVIVGRPRPDFFFRCFPDGILHLSNNNVSMLPQLNCTGNEDDINEGYKSFPSGHSSFAFAAYSFITFYIGAKLHAFNRQGYGQSWRLCISIAPLILAIVVAVSRTCDYHHHWQDVAFGSIMGLVISYISYRQYYPSIFSINCHRTFRKKLEDSSSRNLYQYKQLSGDENEEDNLVGIDDSLEHNSETVAFPKSPKIEQKTEKWF